MISHKPFIYSWGRWNTYHIAEHDVTPLEAEYIVERAKPPFPRRTRQEKFIVWGKTLGGRYLQVIYALPLDENVDHATLSPADLVDFVAGKVQVVFVLHARDLTDSEKHQLRRRR